MFKRRGWKIAVAAMIGSAGFLITPTAAMADVTVPVGGSGSTCSAYKTIVPTNLSWRSCVHATASIRYYTTWIKNTGSGGVFVDNVQMNPREVGTIDPGNCAGVVNYYAPANSTTRTETALCDFPRGSAKTIYTHGVVREGSYAGASSAGRSI